MGPGDILRQAVDLHQRGRLAEAERLYASILEEQPHHFDASHFFGILRHQQGRNNDALNLIDAALKTQPEAAPAHSSRAAVLNELGRHAEALASCDRALAGRPDQVDALVNRGNALRALRRGEDALVCYDRALALQPHHPEVLYNRGIVLIECKRYNDALATYDRLLMIVPNDPEAQNNRGFVLKELGRIEEALASYEQALTIHPNYPEALNNRGSALKALSRAVEALTSFDKALALKPDYAEALNNRGNALAELKRLEDALSSYDRALALKPNYAGAMVNRGSVLIELKRYADANASYARALAVEPDHPHALSGLANSARAMCDWTQTEKLTQQVVKHVMAEKPGIAPWTLLGYSDDPAVQLACACRYVTSEIPHRPPLWTATRYRHDKIRIAYLSGDFRQHPVAHLIAELIELHDRSRFDVFGISFGPDDKSEMRSRIMKACDRFHDVRSSNDHKIAQLLRQSEIDIAVDLMGHTQEGRLGILAYRPVPIQVNYLGFAGTTGANFVDYILADEIIAPFDHQPFYAEKIVHLPDSYLVNDSKRVIGSGTPTRRDAGLPEDGFVFCCFNNSFKLTAPVFDVWMRLLRAVEGSVLWLRRADARAEENLQREAAARGVDGTRLVFAGRMDLPQHLARHRLADLFLDTLPYNAHSTASDALWAGLPVLTCCGKAFAARVGASLLHSVGLPELVTHNLADYEALALKLASERPRLADVARKLEQNRLACPLFDTDRFRHHIEAAYTMMRDIWQRGEAPRSFAIAAEKIVGD